VGEGAWPREKVACGDAAGWPAQRFERWWRAASCRAAGLPLEPSRFPADIPRRATICIPGRAHRGAREEGAKARVVGRAAASIAGLRAACR
jgi:hypothetical protein